MSNVEKRKKKKASVILNIEVCAPIKAEDLAQIMKKLNDGLAEYKKRNANAEIHINISLY